ncbi:MAG: hypothetical protein LBR93_00940 [Treponema sp.]|jgi:hypothetical protein|nr:hypothetical protein [Treponema sp.]
MDEENRRKFFPPARKLEKLGVAAIADIAGGVFLFVLGILGARFPLLGIILGGLSVIAGIAAIRSRDPADRKAGAILAAGGGLAILSRVGAVFFQPLAGTLLSIGAFGLFAMGIWKGIRFLMGLRRRG